MKWVTVLAKTGLPRQVDFKAGSEEWGSVRLSDGSEASTRVILADLWIVSEDIIGPRVVHSSVIALRVKCPADVIDAVKDKPFLQTGRPIPLTKEEGFEALTITEHRNPTRSAYRFDDFELSLELEAVGAARNMGFRVGAGVPLYNLRWSTKSRVKKALGSA
jgi:hypothetical protein